MRKILTWSLVLALGVAVPVFGAQAAGKQAQDKTPAGPVNVNTASQTDLETLPGVGPATAKKIIAGRPYTSVSDLGKAGVPKNTIEKIASLVTVGSAATTPLAPTPAPTPTPAVAAPVRQPSSTATPTAAQQPPVKGMVWVNLSTKVYHKEGDRYYGSTKNGTFMTEADAMKAGYRAAKTAGEKKQ